MMFVCPTVVVVADSSVSVTCRDQGVVPVSPEDEGLQEDGGVRGHEYTVHPTVLPLQHQALGAFTRVRGRHQENERPVSVRAHWGGVLV